MLITSLVFPFFWFSSLRISLKIEKNMICEKKIENWKYEILYLINREYTHFCNNIWQRMTLITT